MSSLIFHTDDSQALVATDTLAVSHDGEPVMFTTKAFIVPHLRLIIAGTGLGGFAGRWFIEVNDRLVVRGIDNLDQHAPDYLSSGWGWFKDEIGYFGDLTATIYHFGFSEVTGVIHSYAYRSEHDFRSEPLGYGCGAKPTCTVAPNYEFPNDVLPMMLEQRELQSKRPAEERLYIGGQIQIVRLSQRGFNCYTLATFDDFDADEQAIYDQFQ